VSRSQRPRRRGYQPYPERRARAWIARLLVVAVGVILIIGSLALFSGVAQ
jgi:hypothetical protein